LSRTLLIHCARESILSICGSYAVTQRNRLRSGTCRAAKRKKTFVKTLPAKQSFSQVRGAPHHSWIAQNFGLSPEPPDSRYRRVLWATLGINGTMFLIEIIAGLMAGSVPLQVDALDFLGGVANYG
jgi:hypothetical protein